MNEKVLIVENSEFYGRLLKRSIINKLGLNVLWFKTYGEAETALANSHNVSVAILSYHLPDAAEGEIIDLCLSYKIPSIVVASTFFSDLQEIIWSKKVIAYVLKDGVHSVNYLIEMIKNFNKNKEIGILVADNSSVSRSHLKSLLHNHQFKVYEASNGIEGMEILESHYDIKLVLTEYQMPFCNGFEFTQKIRQNFPMDKLAIIGLSTKGSHAMMIKFIKYGANDFLSKPFISELFYCRVNQNLRLVEYIENLRESSLIDHMTNIHNRRYLYETGELLLNTATRTGAYFAVAMIDIDDFKNINDSMGHSMGDVVIKKVAEILKNSLRKTDLVTRYGGEEFCIVANNIDPKKVVTLFDNLRTKVNKHFFSCEGEKFNISVSIGVCIEKKKFLSEMIHIADEKLYEAKSQGKNRVSL